MRVGIDIDGTIDKIPEFYSVLTRALLLSGHEVHIVTYRNVNRYDDTRAQLEKWGIQYTNLRLSDQVLTSPEWKALLCNDLELDLFIDNNVDVLAALGNKVIKLWSTT